VAVEACREQLRGTQRIKHCVYRRNLRIYMDRVKGAIVFVK